MNKIYTYSLGVLLALCACTEKDEQEPEVPGSTPEEIILTVSPKALTFDENDASKNVVTVSSNTAWKATVSNDALKIDRSAGTSGQSQITITDAPVGENCKLTVSTVPQTDDEDVVTCEVTVTREATTIIPERTIIYHNDFDKEVAEKNTYWPYLDQFDGWKNATGIGQGSETYDQMSVSVRSDWTSDYAPSAAYKPYASGKNNLYFNKSTSFLAINGIQVGQERDFILQFGSSENKMFDYADLRVEIGNGSSWVELDYTRPLNNNWELTTSEFTVQNITDGTLCIRFSTTGSANMLRIDDVRLTDGEPSSQIIAFDNTSYPPAELPVYGTGDLVVTHYGTIDGQRVRSYTMLFDSEKHAALWVAYPLHSCYRGSSGRTEAWAADPLIDASFQALLYGNPYCYYNNYSRGHQIPSGDRTVNDELNSQTFYASNMTPQNNSFNGGIWESLEGKIRDNMCSDTLYVVTGCYFGDGYASTYDGSYGSSRDPEAKLCPVPTHYFKVILRTRSGNTGKPIGKCSADELKSIGFWIEHRGDLPETFDTEYCTSVEYIEQQTGFTFFPTVDNGVKQQCTPSEWVL